MLQVSNAIREEFQAILYSKGVFDMGYGLCKQIQRSDIPFVNEILNVTITVILHAMSNLCKSQLDGFWSDEEEAEPPLDPILEPEPVSHFTGTSIMRNACVIELNTRGPTALSALLSSPVVHAISQLIGFKTVRLVFFTMVDYWVETRTPVNIRESINNHGTCLGFDTLVLQVSSALEPALGSFTVTRGRDSNMRWCQDVTFHPQDHSTAKMNKLETVSSSRTEEMTSAYPFLEWTERYGPKWENHQSVSTHFLHKRSPINSPDVGATVVNGSQQF